tara:strand:- start:327 stop:452 length:126 start_codon:yes stop_codon:yes gene_type:complete
VAGQVFELPVLKNGMRVKPAVQKEVDESLLLPTGQGLDVFI